MIRAASRAARSSQEPLTWPQDLSHDPVLKIGEVRSRLAGDFPLLTVSKIRHYESIELIHPHRTASNQRLFSEADIERLRFILTEQRDRYLPLSQIGELLRQLDAGEQPVDVHPGRMRVIDDGELRRPQPGTRLRLAEVSELTGVSVAEIDEMLEAGILKADSRGRLTAQAPEIVRLASLLRQAGYDLRQIRTIRTSAHAHAVMITNSLVSQPVRTSPAAGERAIAQAAETSALVSHLYRALLTENVEIEMR
ncbi:MAG: MerR family transcriptional regulator [Actinomycetaceae bacterium]|jgi:DNA-binding transcriptional MerR regulator|nr:MerR family transcriptional regulator [Actinomycetaceae bacterium]